MAKVKLPSALRVSASPPLFSSTTDLPAPRPDRLPPMVKLYSDEGTITMPTPESRSQPAASMSSAEAFMDDTIWALVAAGLAPLIRAAMAAAVGAAAEVPQNGMKPGVVVVPQSPAAMSTFCRVVPPLVANSRLPGVMAVPFGW